ncbi:hypothetical protein KC333_g40 [Hortaea werneckii]|nr:hypothetical protein KC333_g40 [Hortaea werneckii]
MDSRGRIGCLRTCIGGAEEVGLQVGQFGGDQGEPVRGEKGALGIRWGTTYIVEDHIVGGDAISRTLPEATFLKPSLLVGLVVLGEILYLSTEEAGQALRKL